MGHFRQTQSITGPVFPNLRTCELISYSAVKGQKQPKAGSFNHSSARRKMDSGIVSPMAVAVGCVTGKGTCAVVSSVVKAVPCSIVSRTRWQTKGSVTSRTARTNSSSNDLCLLAHPRFGSRVLVFQDVGSPVLRLLLELHRRAACGQPPLRRRWSGDKARDLRTRRHSAA
jgi:hypothetical protein